MIRILLLYHFGFRFSMSIFLSLVFHAQILYNKKNFVLFCNENHF
jgi:hypothetical protein